MCEVMEPARTTLARSLESPGRAREYVEQRVCPVHGSEGMVALQLLASELVTNAVLYGSAPIGLELSCSGHAMHVEVRHAQRRSPEADPTAGSQSGFLLVAKVAHEWGVETADDERIVWCTLRTGFVPRQRAHRARPRRADARHVARR
jgi:hypothetical protein